MAFPNLRKSLLALYSVGMWLGIASWNSYSYGAPTVPDWTKIYIIIGLVLLVNHFAIYVYSRAKFTLETAYLIGASLTIDIHVVAWAGLAVAVISAVRGSKHWSIFLMNSSGLTLCTVVSRIVFGKLTDQYTLTAIVPLLVYALVYIGLNLGFIVLYYIIMDGLPGLRQFRTGVTKEFFGAYAVGIGVGLITGVLFKQSMSAIFLLTALLILVSITLKDYFNVVNHYKELTIRDELTGLHNHRHLQSQLDALVSGGKTFSCLLLDIDQLKKYNEICGHETGDEALKSLANLLTEHVPKTAEIARYGGDEFVIVLPNADIETAKSIAEDLKHLISNTSFPGQSTNSKAIFTVSFGVASFPTMAQDKRTLLMMVEDALYRGKFAGKNRVNIYKSVISELEQTNNLDDERRLLDTIKVLLMFLNAKDKYTYAHTERDVRYATALGEYLGLSESSLKNLKFGALLHDIGKVEVPLEILTKPDKLTDLEWEIMKSHVNYGESIVQPMKGLEDCIPIIRHHHEKYDGTGYPGRLRGNEIPLEARILTIADSFDAMTTSRPYQKKRSMESAFAELRRCAGTQFDPDLVEPFIKIVRETGLILQEDELDEVAATNE